MTPHIRQWLYTISAVASAVIPLLVFYEVIGSDEASAWVNVVGILGAVATGGSATAAVVLNRQRKEGTLDFTGSPAEQAIGALQAAVGQAVRAATDLDKVKHAAIDIVGQVEQVTDIVAPGSLVDRMLDSASDGLRK